MGAGNVSCHRRGSQASVVKTQTSVKETWCWILHGRNADASPYHHGVLGNNAKNVMAATTGDNRVTNEQPEVLLSVDMLKDRSKTGPAKETADHDPSISRPNVLGSVLLQRK